LQHGDFCCHGRSKTPRAIFERLARDGEHTVRVLTGHSGVSQPAIPPSKIK
jgi:hypothetical protein